MQPNQQFPKKTANVIYVYIYIHIYIYIIFPEWPWFCWVFFFPPSSPRWPNKKITTRGKRAFKRDARREKRAQAAAGVRKAGVGGGFFQPERCCNWKKEVGNGEFKNTCAYYVYMYIFMRYYYIIITIFMIKSLSFELCFFSSSLS